MTEEPIGGACRCWPIAACRPWAPSREFSPASRALPSI